MTDESLIASAYAELCQRWRTLSDADRQMQLDSFKVSFSYDSGCMENPEITYHDTAEVFDKDGVSNFTGDVRTVFEMVNLKRAWEWLRRSVAERHTLTVDLILEAHRVLTQGTYDERRWERGERPGRFKMHDYRVADDVGLPPEEVPEAMCELASEVADALEGRCADRRLLVIAAYLHAKLVSIHPFADGNGRCARLLMNRTLMVAGLPPLTIAETDRLAYFGALDAFCRDGELAPFTEFCQIQSLRTWEGLVSSATI